MDWLNKKRKVLKLDLGHLDQKHSPGIMRFKNTFILATEWTGNYVCLLKCQKYSPATDFS